MKVLIVDDEELTRKGLISSINWTALGIKNIFQADDGMNALEIAKSQEPDIILCDVRMPRMNGIQLGEQLETILPDISIIFMSGYSDKEYLKAAIKLKAVNYVEKPLNPQEVMEAVIEAKERCQEKWRSRRNESLHCIETSSRLALLLTRPYEEHRETISALTSELGLSLETRCSFTTYIVKTNHMEQEEHALLEIHRRLDSFLQTYHLQRFSVFVRAAYHVFHIAGNKIPSATALLEIEKFLSSLFLSSGDFFVSRGDTVMGISKAYQSYSSAVVLLQSSFFFEAGSVLSPLNKDFETTELTATLSCQNPPSAFLDVLLSKDRKDCFKFLNKLYSFYYRNRTLLPNQAKDVYYQLFLALNESRQKMQLPLDSLNHTIEESALEHIENCFSYQNLHQMLCEKTEQLFRALDSYTPENSIIFLIKDYIGKHYSNESLSIKEISEHVFLSASYVCTYFKTQTGQTLNQYLTECRMEKAKLLLVDPRYQIADISAKVGYSNGNYFSKSFKKFTGLSPSEYRETMVQ